jgi:lipopolysaccharide export system protein LptA
MRLGVSVKRLRWVLLASATLLVVLLAAFLGYGHFRMRNIAQKIIDRAKQHISEGITYSDSVGGKINYTLHADKVETKSTGTKGDEVYILHGVKLDLYGRTQGGVDHVYGKDFEYDRTVGTVKALGMVDMDIQAPTSMGGRNLTTPNAAAPGEPENIHVKTSGLVYVKSLGVAATGERVDFTYGTLRGSSQGAEFDNGRNVLRLLAQVEATGDVRGQPIHLTASKGDFDRTANVAAFENAVVVTSGERSGKADHSIAYLRHDSSVERLEGQGGVVLSQGTRQVTATHLDATFSTASVIDWMKLTGGVVLTDTSAQKPMHGGANEAEVKFDAKGSPAKIVATGGANVLEVDHRTNGPAQGLRRSLSGNQITMNFVQGAVPAGSPKGTKPKSILRELHAVAGAKALGDSWSVPGGGKGSPVLKTSQVAADDLLGEFVEGARGEAELKTLHGNGHTQLQQDTSLGAEQVSTSDTLEAVLVAPTGASPAGAASGSRIESAVQTGHVTIHSRPVPKPGTKPDVTAATAERANYDGATEKLRLIGNAHVNDDTTEMFATTIVVDQPTGDAEAEGNVVAAMLGSGTNSGQSNASAQVTHVLAASGKLQHAAKLAEFHGTDAQPAKMWQGASQVEAANLFLDGDKHTMAARSQASGALIHAVFAQANAGSQPTASPKPATTDAKPSKPASTGPKPAGNSVARVAAQKMDYSDQQREATFVGEVRIDGLTGNTLSQRAVVYLTPTAKNGTGTAAPGVGITSGSVDHIVLNGEVQVQQPGRHATGDMLLYTATTGRYVLTGSPGHLPKAVDAQQGTVTGVTLTFGDSGSTIIVAGEPATSKGKGTRVRTETEVRPEGKK